MATTTTNYGFDIPQSTDLVKDGATAIATLGQDVDTQLKALNPSTTLGDIEYRSSTANTNTRLGIGSTGQVLTVSSGVPAWTTPSSGGGMTLIQEEVASALSSLDFSSISGSYKDLYLVWHGINHSETGSYFGIRFNSDSASNYKNRYALMESAVGYAADSVSGTNTGDTSFGQNTNTTTEERTAAGSLLIKDYASTTKKKFFHLEYHQYTVSNGRNNWFSNQGTYSSTSAITSINIFRGAGSATFSNLANTSIRLYGVS